MMETPQQKEREEDGGEREMVRGRGEREGAGETERERERCRERNGRERDGEREGDRETTRDSERDGERRERERGREEGQRSDQTRPFPYQWINRTRTCKPFSDIGQVGCLCTCSGHGVCCYVAVCWFIAV